MARNLTHAGWRRVELLDTIDSTNAHALRDPCAWQIVVAHEQVAGRGRLDRRWQVPAGFGVTMSMTVLLPGAGSSDADASGGPATSAASPGEAPSAWGWVPLFAGEAVRSALAGLVGAVLSADASGGTDDAGGADTVEVGLKWPNDVVVRSGGDEDDAAWRKLGGLLCQVVPRSSLPSPTQQGAGAPSPLVVIGVGLNVAQERRDLPATVPGITAATSLRLHGVEVARDDVVLAVADRVRRAAQDWADPENLHVMREAVRRHCVTLGALVDVHEPAGDVRRCRVVELDDDGRIVTEQHSGSALSGASRRVAYSVAYSVADVVHARLNGGSGS